MVDTHVNRIMQLCDWVNDELAGSKKYIMLAMKMKGTDKATADTFFKMGEGEYGHAENLVSMAGKEVQAAKDSGEDMKSVMQCVYDWEKGKHIEKMTDIKNMMAMYKQ